MSILARFLGLVQWLAHYLSALLYASQYPQPAQRHAITPRAGAPGRIVPHTVLDTDGFYRATFVFQTLPVAEVRRMLPARLEPAAQHLVPAGQHPVMLVFGEQRHVRPIVHRGPGLAYREFILAVPFVQWTDPSRAYRGPFVFLPRLFLDRWLPVFLGWCAGFSKRLERVESTASTYSVSHRKRRRIIQGSFTHHGSAGRPEDFPLFEPIRAIFELPLVTKLAIGPFLAMSFDWQLSAARMRAMDAGVRIDEAFVPGLSVGHFHSGGIDEASLGAFSLDVPWRLSIPVSPSTLHPA